MYKKLLVFATIFILAGIFLKLYQNFDGSKTLNKTASYYAKNGASEVGSTNIVTAIVVTYRGFDTLGEVTILFVAAAIIGFFLKTNAKGTNRIRNLRFSSEIMITASKILMPIMFLIGAYVFVNGHLSPGGGFQGGAIIASGVAFFLLANPTLSVNHKVLSVLESTSGLIFVLLGIAGLIYGGGFLDNRVLPLGKFGTLFSAGIIPLVYSFIGLKVGAELSNIISSLQQIQKEE
ncbi:MAG: sodium:proton antiporter [Chlorobi bacterium]|nr:sodium:proton antiporter [Chlorobiota bacterium]